ncbi:hypothetical protein [Candidatus Venteria ishoeyi]|uniref:Uncharacterized protein n=1 Tax=Candidatus Venteria ishoeyi TaxID=1899563 RepID=A0A1H6FDK1_9GAMM|nr:hypothetical protein [Candidatus Venteria ishoeyi]SEH07236.1 Uncharacterised protein [Candidatus Venteria ishoeyi]
MRFKSSSAFYQELHGFCIERLKESFNPDSQLFDLRLHNRHWGLVEGTENSSSTAMVLIALHRADIDVEGLFSLQIKSVLKALTDLHRFPVYHETLGLLIWANAIWDGSSLSDLLQELGLSLIKIPALTRNLKSAELAWLVSGFAHEYRRSGEQDVLETLKILLTQLQLRQHKTSHVFYHYAHNAPLRLCYRRHVTTFADQVYPVQALAFASILLKEPGYLQQVQPCVQQIVDLQGKLGQWWWHYDARNAQVLQAYPVYSVHQHAMAPMMLMALAAAGGKAHTAAMSLSHAWQDHNEINANMTDREVGTMWRDIEYDENKLASSFRKARSVMGQTRDRTSRLPKLKIRYDTWPYEWGWCLYAQAIATTAPPSQHLI